MSTTRRMTDAARRMIAGGGRVAPESGGGPRRATPWIVSLSLHAGLVVMACFVVWSVTPRGVPDRAPVVVRFDDPAPAPPPAIAEADAPESPAPAAARRWLDRNQPPPPDLPDALASLMPETPRLPEAPAPVVSRDVTPRDVEARFAGLGASNARDIVYVVDGSGSMVTSFPDVLAELRRSIERLHPTQRFAVFVFRNTRRGGEASDFEWPRVPAGVRRPVLLDATRENKQAVFAWLGELIPGGRADPLPALERALRLRPDAVFLLSTRLTLVDDPGFDARDFLARIDALNPVERRSGRRATSISVIEIIEPDPRGVLRSLATRHGGEDAYTFIDVDTLIQRRTLRQGAEQ